MTLIGSDKWALVHFILNYWVIGWPLLSTSMASWMSVATQEPGLKIPATSSFGVTLGKNLKKSSVIRLRALIVQTCDKITGVVPWSNHERNPSCFRTCTTERSSYWASDPQWKISMTWMHIMEANILIYRNALLESSFSLPGYNCVYFCIFLNYYIYSRSV